MIGDAEAPQLQSEKEHGDNDKQVPSTLSQAQPVQTQQQLLSLPRGAIHIPTEHGAPLFEFRSRAAAVWVRSPHSKVCRYEAESENRRSGPEPISHGQPDSMPIKCEFSDLVELGGDPEFSGSRHSRATSYMKSLLKRNMTSSYVVKLKKCRRGGPAGDKAPSGSSISRFLSLFNVHGADDLDWLKANVRSNFPPDLTKFKRRFFEVWKNSCLFKKLQAGALSG